MMVIFNYIIGFLLSLFILFSGYFLGKFVKEELKESYKYLLLSLIILNCCIFYITLFQLDVFMVINYSLLGVMFVGSYLLKPKLRILLSTFIYFFAVFIIITMFNKFLLGLLIILGLIIASIYYHMREQLKIL